MATDLLGAKIANPYAEALLIKIELEFVVMKTTKKIINKIVIFTKYFIIFK